MNKVILAGTASAPEYTHKVFGEKFYRVFLDVERTSGTHDILPCTISEAFLDFEPGSKIKVAGEMRTRNVHRDGKSYLDIFVLVREMLPYENRDENSVEIDGYICKEPDYRETPRGRWISDFICRVHRGYGYQDKKYYIPCITWGRNALRASKLDVGTKISANGRLQSREYEKQLDGETVVKTAYELSIATFSIEDDED